MNYLIDTCTISDFFKKNPQVVEHFKGVSPNQIYISTISVMEVEYGLKLSPDRERKIRPLWNALTGQVQIIPISEKCAIAAASLRAKLKNTGLPIGPFDILIAGSALANNLTVVTSNLKEFQRLSEISIEDWRI